MQSHVIRLPSGTTLKVSMTVLGRTANLRIISTQGDPDTIDSDVWEENVLDIGSRLAVSKKEPLLYVFPRNPSRGNQDYQFWQLDTDGSRRRCPEPIIAPTLP